ncbi:MULTISPECIES: response regulator [Clostridium]|uniref:response regulator transcription factor n=1 Tax=Clostridium TaxID=1485 RepID=UPI001A9B1E30|nr:MULTISPECIES: response regulator [Clostridium]MCR1950509.1 response regulator [Clostridium sp. DSM 100503]MDI9217300.1 response regulator [Clostridium tertium]MDU2155487.1 response regulator [Clostridium sp.]
MKTKIIIVDDEYLIRNLIRNCIDWDEIDIEIVGEASNAHECLKLIEKNKPDIVLTDINMPLTNGLDMSQHLLEKYPEIRIIIITGYDKFEYAKRSIRLGISDFILKPIDDEELKEAVLRLKEKIEKEKAEINEVKSIKETIGDLTEIIELEECESDKCVNINQIKKYIIKNISNKDLSLKSVAQHFYINSSYLSRIFKEKTNENFGEYIIKTKMEIALKMLENPNIKAYEISKKLGFDDPNYFSNWFKKYSGLSIKDYRNSMVKK